MRVLFSSVCLCLSLGLATVLSGATSVSSQPVIVDAQHVTFNLSPDDGATTDNGIALIDRYTLQIFIAGSRTLVEGVDLGKPTPDADGTVRLAFLPLLYVPLTPGVVYEAVVQANGPFGSADSNRSNPFTYSVPPCDPWISPVSIDVDAAGGPNATMVHAAAGCSWTAMSNDAWLTITGGHSGAGNGTVTFTVARNTDRNTRNGSLTIAGSTFRVNQDGARADEGKGKGDKDKDKDRDKDNDKDKDKGKGGDKDKGADKRQ